ncbi:MAG: hypothetical protein JNM31_15680 [Flavobacteriales bacterium]|nr:hypothetical protein [Flavobacteriales bacterium]
MLLYLTHNDQPGGVYWSQVTDVVNHLNSLGSERVRLVALVSARGWWQSRKAIRAHCPDALVLPQWPGVRNWERNVLLLSMLCRWLRPKGVIARGVFATWMGLRLREKGLVGKVCFDGRGAYAAEWEEYRVVDDDVMIAAMRPLESEAVNASDFRIAVSQALVAHWKERYGYSGTAHVVIPCTLGTDASINTAPGQVARRAEKITLVYAGSTAGWQSFGLLEQLLVKVLEAQPDVDVLFLSKEDANNRRLRERFPGRVRIEWLSAAQVPSALSACDFGLLVREDTLTNRVASPTKFAEYLAAGLPVLISPYIGDFSALVEREQLGQIVALDGPIPALQRPSSDERTRMKRFAMEWFTKGAFDAHYRRVIEALA